MPTFGIGGYQFEYEVGNNAVTFKFWDPEDANNTAEVTIDKKDLPKGVSSLEGRIVSDLAFRMAAKTLNSKRDARIKKQTNDATNAKVDSDAITREQSEDFLANAKDVKTEPDFVTKDGTNVFTGGPAGQDVHGNPVTDPEASSSSSSKK
jgi:hypothetical protein